MIRRLLSPLHRLRMTLPTRAAYKFLTRNWRGINDADLLGKVVASDYFRDELKPVEVPASSIKRPIVVAPHPDDEVIGCGGLLASVSQHDAEIQIVYATNGDQGTNLERTASLRRAEAGAVCEQLGAKQSWLGVSSQGLEFDSSSVHELAHVIRKHKPDAIFIPWLFDGPTAHRLCNLAFYVACKRFEVPDCSVWQYAVHTQPFPNVYVDITDVVETKRKLIQLYTSQTELVPYDHYIIGFNAWSARLAPDDGCRRFVEPFFTIPLSETLELFQNYYLPDLDRLMRGHALRITRARELIALL